MSTLPKLVPVARDALSRELSSYDALVVVSASPLPQYLAQLALPSAIASAIEQSLASDRALARGAQLPVVLPVAAAPGGRLVLATTTTLLDDTDDVRLVGETVALAVARTCAAGSRKPLLAIAVPDDGRYTHALDVAALAALGSQWQALEAREAGRGAEPIETLGLVGIDAARAAYATAIETGRWLCRDITGTEPERMAPLRAAELCERSFEGTGVKVTVERDVSAYPLLSAVARASNRVERHKPCVVRLEYAPSGPITRTLLLAGKGVTYDTGGADLKTDGSMAGMSRDKGGAGAVAGLVRAIAEAKGGQTRVVALLGMVRNSIGEESFVSDEVIASHAGVRVRIGNTDAEGRLVLADLLSALRVEAQGAPDPLLASVATLTGHVYRAFGPYTGMVENGASRAKGVVAKLTEIGERWAEPAESTRVRREDYAYCAPRSNTEDLVSSNRLASVSTPRGHQGPFAFLDVASGIKPSGLAFVHIDIAGVAVSPADWQFGRPTGVPVAMLAGWCVGE